MAALLFFLLPSARADVWTTHARRLSGISEEAHREALAALRKTWDLDARLLTALEGPDKALALDAMVALKLTRHVPALLAAPDRDGTVAIAVGSLLTDENKQAVADAFGSRLAAATKTPVPALAQLAMLDTLARLDALLPEELLLSLLRSRSYEVRDGVVSFSRSRMRAEKSKRYAGVLAAAMTAAPWQLRVQALHAARELGIAVSARCVADSHPEVRRLCSEVRR